MVTFKKYMDKNEPKSKVQTKSRHNHKKGSILWGGGEKKLRHGKLLQDSFKWKLQQEK